MNFSQRKNVSIPARIIWWEKQRIAYNLIMAAVGFVSFFIGYISIPLVYILIAINLNILFTASWILEILFIIPFSSENVMKKYTWSFMIIFYCYSIIGVLFFSLYPSLLDWTFMLYRNL